MSYDITQLLKDKGIDYAKSNNPYEIKIKCTSGAHIDTNPSLGYDLSKNMFHCWSCGFKGGQRKFLESLGVYTKIEFTSRAEFRTQQVLRNIRGQRYNTLKIPATAGLFLSSFKKITAEVMEDFGAFTTEEMNLEGYICFPIYQHGQLRFIDSRINKKESNKPKYLRRPIGVDTKDILYPLDRLINNRDVILVEGIFDMLYMHQLGYVNTLTVFGAQSFTNKKLLLLQKLGIINATIMLDGDLAGRIGMEKMRTMLESKHINTKVIYLDEGKDIDDYEPEEVKELLKK